MNKNYHEKKKKTVAKKKVEISTEKGNPSYLNRLNAMPLNDKVGKVFITSTKKRK